jgi:hypothetical protein
MSSSDAIDRVNTAGLTIFLGCSIGSFITGTIGLVLNVLVFNRPALRRNPCSLYFLASTYANMFVVFIILPMRVISTIFNVDLAYLNIGLCKLEYYLFLTMRSLAIWFIVLACVDRYIHTLGNELQRRRLSSSKMATRSIVFVTILLFLAYIHVPINYLVITQTDRLNQVTSACIGPQGIYRTFANLWHAVLYSVCPAFVMFIFGLLTLINIRRRRRQIAPRVVDTRPMTRRSDNELLRMLTVQVLIIMLSTFPYPVYQAYASTTVNIVKSQLRIAEDRMGSQIVAGTAYVAHASGFYLFTLTGTIFRKELIKILKQFHCPCFRPREPADARCNVEVIEMIVTPFIQKDNPIRQDV